MHSWFTQKLNEMIGLAHYCQYPVLKAHFVLTQQAVDEIYNERKPDDSAMDRILELLVKQAENDGDAEVTNHLRRALHAVQKPEVDTTNIVELTFGSQEPRRRESGV